MVEITGWCKKNTWMGFSVGGIGMDSGTDMLVFSPDEMTVKDQVAVGYMMPKDDSN